MQQREMSKQILCSWAKSLGAYVIGSVTSEARFDIAKDAGCDMVINQSKEDCISNY